MDGAAGRRAPAEVDAVGDEHPADGPRSGCRGQPGAYSPAPAAQAEWEVTELKAGRSFTWVTRSPSLHVAASHHIEATAPGSRVTLSLEFSGLLGPLVARLTRGLNERYLALEAHGLKARSEAGGTVPDIDATRTHT